MTKSCLIEAPSCSDLNTYFPSDPNIWGNGRIILTTRDSNIENSRYVNNLVQVGELTPEQKLNLFMKIMSNGKKTSFTNAQRKSTKNFLAEIPPFPLDISVSAYYLKATHIPYKKYLENMSTYNRNFSDVQKKILQEIGGYTKTRYGIITLTIKRLIKAHKDFKELLLFISLLDSQNIPRELLTTFKDDFVVDNFIYHLNKFSLITNKSINLPLLESTFSIHRSIQAKILSHLFNTLDLSKKVNLTRPINSSLESYIRDAVDKEDFSKMKNLYPHAEHVLGHSDLLSNKDKGILMGELACIYCYLSHHSKAKLLFEKSLSILSSERDSNDKIARFLLFLGNVYKKTGEYNKAKELFERSIKTYQKSPNDIAGAAKAYGYLGTVFEGLGDLKQAKVLLEKSIDMYKKCPSRRIGLAWALAHLGSVYKNIGDYEKAKELFEQSLKIYMAHSENYVGSSWVLGDLGNVYTKLGDFEKAKHYLEKSLKILSQYFFDDHIYVARTSIHLGNYYKEVGEYEKAKHLLRKELVVIEKNYGKKHVETACVLKSLGQVHLLEGNLDEAENILRESLNIFQINKHPEEHLIFEDLAEVYLTRANIEKSKGFIEKSESFKSQSNHYLNESMKILKNHFPEKFAYRPTK
ncbi:MAG: tetratricopeptide repeat protein [Alphaproteobacteria bacterium]|nr:tetratricopeptide repeat protein [Alphaproteobacteria bacterium]